MTAFSPSERHTIVLFQKGDKNAFLELYARYAPAILGMLTRVVGDREQAEKYLDESFCTFWSERHTYDTGKERLFTWMVKIALDCVEAKAVKTKHVDLHIRELVDLSCGMDVGSYLRNKKCVEALGTYVDPPIKQAIEMLYFKPYSYNTAAEKLRFSVNFLKREVIRTIRKLKHTDIPT
ncbi:DNA-directed RNA polymerase specialized sigma24 family protein [Pedobacter sp. UYEF25]